MKNINKQKNSKKYAICIVAYQPDERLIQLYDNLNKTNYDFYVVVDDNNFDIQYLETKYPTFHFIKINEEDCKQKGYYGLNYYIKKGEPSGWEKAIYYFCENKINQYSYIWFLEDDVFIPHQNTLYDIDHLKNTQNIDFISKSNESFSAKWEHSDAVLKIAPSFLHKSLHISLICAIRISNAFLIKIKEYIQENGRMFFAESFFITLANEYHLSILNPDFMKTIFFRKNWTIQNILQHPHSIIHPIKNISQQVNFRSLFQPNTKYFIIPKVNDFKNILLSKNATSNGFHFIQKIGFIPHHKSTSNKFITITQDNTDFYFENIDIFPNETIFLNQIKINSLEDGINMAINLGFIYHFYENMITENYFLDDVTIQIVNIPSLIPFVQISSYSTQKLDEFLENMGNIGNPMKNIFEIYRYNSQMFDTNIKPFSNHEFKKLEKSVKYIKKNKKLFEDLIQHQTTLYKNVIENLQKNILLKIKTSNNFVNVH